jgi:hypothetical protein
MDSIPLELSKMDSNRKDQLLAASLQVLVDERMQQVGIDTSKEDVKDKKRLSRKLKRNSATNLKLVFKGALSNLARTASQALEGTKHG